MDRIGHDVARDDKEREKRAENSERRLPKQIHLGGKLISTPRASVNQGAVPLRKKLPYATPQ